MNDFEYIIDREHGTDKGRNLMIPFFAKIKKQFEKMFLMSSGVVEYSERFNFSKEEIKQKKIILLEKLKLLAESKGKYQNLSFKGLAKIGLKSKSKEVQTEINKIIIFYTQKAAIASDLMELSLYQAIESGDILSWKTQSNFKEAMKIFKQLPLYIQKISLEKIEKFDKGLHQRDKLIGLDGKKVVFVLFGFTPSGDVEIEMSPFSVNIYFEKFEDFKLFQGDDYNPAAGGLAETDENFGQIIVIPREVQNPATGELHEYTEEQIKMVLDHETQHAKFSYINPFDTPRFDQIEGRVNNVLSDLRSVNIDIESVGNDVANLFSEIKKNYFLRTKNEILAFVKGGAESVAEIKSMIRLNYNFIMNFSQGIKAAVLRNRNLYSKFNIEVLFHLIDNQVNIYKKDVDKLLQDLLDDEKIFDNPEKITQSTLSRIDNIFDRKK